jgi:hypothetical protein
MSTINRNSGTHQPESTGQASTGKAQSVVHPGCQQSASNPASHSLAPHMLAIEASPVYLRRRDVEAGRAWGC